MVKKLIVRPVSDLHLEHMPRAQAASFELSRLDTDKDSVLILAGDVSSDLDMYEDFVHRHVGRFKAVAAVSGNHDFYGHEYHAQLEELRRMSGRIAGFSMLENNLLRVDGTVILGCCLWSNFAENPLNEWHVSRGLNDYQQIRFGNRLLRTADVKGFFAESFAWLDKAIGEADANATVVVTHNAPSYKSVEPRFRGDDLNSAFVNELEREITDRWSPDLWIHGHVHAACNYTLEVQGVKSTEVVCNPYGYPGEHQNNGYQDKVWHVD